MNQKRRIDFLIELVRRRIIEKYIGSTYIILWVIFVPLIPLLTNLLVFFYIARIPQIKEMGILGYSVFIFSGLLPYRIFQRSITQANGLIIENMHVLKNAIFPLDYLGIASTGAILFEFFIQIIFMVLLLLLSGVGLSWNFFLLPLAIVFFVLLILGCTWIISVLGYLIRDIREPISVLFMALVYITPTMYPSEAAPPLVQKLISWNPLTHLIIVFRDTFLPEKGLIHYGSWLYFIVFSVVLLLIGYTVISKVSRFVGDLV